MTKQNPHLPKGLAFLGVTAGDATFSLGARALFLAGGEATAGSSSSPSRKRLGLILRPLRLTTSVCSLTGLAAGFSSLIATLVLDDTAGVFLVSAGVEGAVLLAMLSFLICFLTTSSLTDLLVDSSPLMVSSFSVFVLVSTTVEFADILDALKLA